MEAENRAVNGVPMIIRDAEPGDARAIAEVTVRAWQKAYDHILPPSLLAGLTVEPRERFWREQLTLGDMVVLVAETGNAIVGHLGMGKARDPDCGPEVWEILSIYVSPGSWGLGAGRRLLEHALDERLPADVRRLVLWVLAENRRARRFYEAAGFTLEADSRRTVSIGKTAYPEVRYRLPVSTNR